jgi:hypothetical protein
MLRNVTQITALQTNSVTGDQAQTKVIVRGENDQIGAILLLPPQEKNNPDIPAATPEGCPNSASSSKRNGVPAGAVT